MIPAAHNRGIFPILAFLVLAIVAVFTSLNRRRVRQDRSWSLQLLATELKFDEFNPDRDETFAMGWGFLSRLAQGGERYAFNILRGKYHEQALFVFDYHFQTGSDRSKVDHNLTILMLVFPVAFPKLTIGAEGLGARIAAAFGIDADIKFESAEFSRSFCVRSPDRKFAYAVCNPQMIEYLMVNRDLQVEIQGPVVLLAFEPQLPVGQIEFNLQRLVEIRSRLPEYLFTNT